MKDIVFIIHMLSVHFDLNKFVPDESLNGWKQSSDAPCALKGVKIGKK